MADDDGSDEDRPDDEDEARSDAEAEESDPEGSDTSAEEGDSDGSDDEDADSDSKASQEGTQPGDWERKPADEEDLRHDDSEEPLAEPLDDDADDDLAEQESGDVTTGDDKGFDRPDSPDEKEVEDTGRRLEEAAEPLLQGSEILGVPTLSLIGIVAFVVVFCVAFFALWALLGSIGILLGIIVGAGLGFGAMKLLADRAR